MTIIIIIIIGFDRRLELTPTVLNQLHSSYGRIESPGPSGKEKEFQVFSFGATTWDNWTLIFSTWIAWLKIIELTWDLIDASSTANPSSSSGQCTPPLSHWATHYLTVEIFSLAACSRCNIRTLLCKWKKSLETHKIKLGSANSKTSSINSRYSLSWKDEIGYGRGWPVGFFFTCDACTVH